MRALELLKAINEARRVQQHDAAAMLQESLNEVDRKGGYSRTQCPQHLVTEDKTQRAATLRANRARARTRRADLLWNLTEKGPS